MSLLKFVSVYFSELTKLIVSVNGIHLLNSTYPCGYKEQSLGFMQDYSWAAVTDTKEEYQQNCVARQHYQLVLIRLCHQGSSTLGSDCVRE